MLEFLFKLQFKFHWNLFLIVQLTMVQHLIGSDNGLASEMTCHYLSPWWLSFATPSSVKYSNLFVLNFLGGNMKTCLHFIILANVRKGSCWWPGHERSLDINGHGICLVFLRNVSDLAPNESCDAITWKLFRRYWPFVRENHWSPMNFPHKGPVTRTFMFLWCGSR